MKEQKEKDIGKKEIMEQIDKIQLIDREELIKKQKE